MKSTTFTYKDQDDIDIFVYKWEPDTEAKAVIQIEHGLAEHALRYQAFAEFLTNHGYVVYADDHRGHGKTIKDGLIGYLGASGWEGTVKSLHELTNVIKKENPNKPIFYFGHSWGSFMGQDVIQQWGSDYKACVLSGTMGSTNKLTLKIGSWMAKRAAKKNPTEQNQKLADTMNGPLNKKWKKEAGATGFEWLSRDKNEVQKYVDDPLCGFPLTSSFYVEFLYGFSKIWKKSNELKVPKDLPIFFIAGANDPVSAETKTIKQLIERYKSNGVKSIESKFYPEDRHEILNELNKTEVYNDVVIWLDKHVN